jgi:hypothetical protein
MTTPAMHTGSMTHQVTPLSGWATQPPAVTTGISSGIGKPIPDASSIVKMTK